MADDSAPTPPMSEPKPLSKKALKRKLKHEQWLATKDERRKARRKAAKERRKERKARQHKLIEQGLLDPKDIKPGFKFSKRAKESLIALMQDAPGVAVDCGFDHKMSDKELGSLASQIRHAYGKNKRATAPLKLMLTDLTTDPQPSPTLTLLKKDVGFNNWVIPWHCKRTVDVYPPDKVVYLCAESETVLETLDQSKLYVIGGIVDRNRHKHLAFNKAAELGVATARLPLQEYMDFSTTRVLTVNHVFEILLEVHAGKKWPDAIASVMPSRKKVAVKKRKRSEDEEKTSVATTTSASSPTTAPTTKTDVETPAVGGVDRSPKRVAVTTTEKTDQAC